MDRLSEIRARCEAFEDSNDSYKGVRPQYILPVLADDGYSRNWAEIAAHSHEDIPYLLARLEKAEAERDAANKCIYDTETYFDLGANKFAYRTIKQYTHDAAAAPKGE